ncbi:PAAR domain-containing protein [Enterobacter sp. MF024]|nr:PAAR domain-containing protein [Enterobacter sp. MF024]
MSSMITKHTIWTGDTTSHGGTLHDGCENDTYNYTHRAVLVGHKFWCPQCMCWSKFVEGTSRYTVHGRARVLEGHRSSCGAFAVHRLGIPYTCDDLPSGKQSEYVMASDAQKAALANQQSDGGYSHHFYINNSGSTPLGYVIFKQDAVLEIGAASKNKYSGSGTHTKVTTSMSEKVFVAMRAPKPLLK